MRVQLGTNRETELDPVVVRVTVEQAYISLVLGLY